MKHNFLIITKGTEFLSQTLFYSTNIFATQCRRYLIFHTMVYVRSNTLSLKYLRFSPSGFNDIGIGKFEFVAKTQILCHEQWTPPPLLFL